MEDGLVIVVPAYVQGCGLFDCGIQYSIDINLII